MDIIVVDNQGRNPDPHAGRWAVEMCEYKSKRRDGPTEWEMKTLQLRDVRITSIAGLQKQLNSSRLVMQKNNAGQEEQTEQKKAKHIV